jgi:flagellar protein FliO/FliZ
MFAQDGADSDNRLNQIRSYMQDGDVSADEDVARGGVQSRDVKIGYFSYIRIIVVLGLVVLAIYVLSLILKRFLRIKGSTGGAATILTNQSLGPGKWIQVVFAGGKYLILGVTNEQINLLSEVTDPREIERLELLIHEQKVKEGDSFLDVITDFFKNILHKTAPKKKFDYETDSVDFLEEQRRRLKKMNGDKDG